MNEYFKNDEPNESQNVEKKEPSIPPRLNRPRCSPLVPPGASRALTLLCECICIYIYAALSGSGRRVEGGTTERASEVRWRSGVSLSLLRRGNSSSAAATISKWWGERTSRVPWGSLSARVSASRPRKSNRPVHASPRLLGYLGCRGRGVPPLSRPLSPSLSPSRRRRRRRYNIPIL